MKDWLKNIKFQHILAVLVVVLGFSFLFYMVSSRFPTDKIPMASDIKMGMINLLTAIVMFYFGSSMSSSKKDDVIHRAAEKNIDNNKNETT